MESLSTQLRNDAVSIYVDLDGTLLTSDTLWESVLLLIKKNPFMIFYLPIWLVTGRASLKREVARRVRLNPAHLPYRPEVLSFLRAERAAGKNLILASGADQTIVEEIARHLGIFSRVMGSDGSTNLSGINKLNALKQDAGQIGFDYIGNSIVDLPIWQAARRAILVHPSLRVLKKAGQVCASHDILAPRGSAFKGFLKALRIHQWVKNLLLFVPLLAAHKLTDVVAALHGFAAFVAFSLGASCIYILNDLFDLEADRQHPTKRNRPFASGVLPITTGIVLAAVLFVASAAVSALFLPPLFVAALILYFVLAVGYTFYFKHALLLDVFLLAGLYSLRILAGAVAVDVIVSPWLLAFSMFVFLSLAFLKRYSELRLMQMRNREHMSGRKYSLLDIDLLRGIGPTSGYLSVLVLALYINSKEVLELYRHPAFLWFINPCLLYWITRMWFLAHRGKMTDDPIVFAIKDSRSYFIGVVILTIVFAASF